MNVRALSFVMAVWLSLSLLSSAHAQSSGAPLRKHIFDHFGGPAPMSVTDITGSTFPHDDIATTFYATLNAIRFPAATSGRGSVATFDLGTDYLLTISADQEMDWNRVRFDIETGEGSALNFAARSKVDNFTEDLLTRGLTPACTPESFGSIATASPHAPIEHRTSTSGATEHSAEVVAADHVTITNLFPEAASAVLLGGGVGLIVLARRPKAT